MISKLFSKEIETHERCSDICPRSLYPEEKKFVQGAVAKRKREFTTGRWCAREALGKLGAEIGPIPVSKNRDPIWPIGIVGSISHTEGWCGAAVGWKEEVIGIGLDIEHACAVYENLWPYVCTHNELLLLKSVTVADRVSLATLIFSAKECLYKCQYPVTKQWIGFKDIEIMVDLYDGCFKALFLVSVGCFGKGASLSGKYLFHDGRVCTGMALSSKVK